MAKAQTHKRRTAGARIRALAAGALLLSAATPAWGASVCLPKGDLADWLSDSYAEGRVAAGLGSGGRLIEVFSTGDGATWTIVMTTAEGLSCVVATGEAWRLKAADSPDPQA